MIQTLQVKNNDLVEAIKEKDNVIQIIRDELTAHQLELVQKEESLKRAETQLSSLKEENASLVDRVVKMKETEAERMNEVNKMLEEGMKQRRLTAPAMTTSPSLLSRLGLSSLGLNEAPPAAPTRSPLIAAKCNVPHNIVKKLSVHDSDINSLAISNDGLTIATGGNDKKIILTDAKTGTIQSLFIPR